MTPEQLRQRLHDIDAEIAYLRSTDGEVRAGVGPSGDGVENSEDVAASLTGIEENEAVIGVLEQRRESILRRLGESGA
jgi:hypothetical protein